MPDDSAAPRYHIPAAEVQQMLQQRSCSIEALLQSLLAPAAAALARPPISNFKVAAAGLASSGDVYIGVNLEFPGQPLNTAVHAEQFLVAMCRQHGESSIDVVAVNAAPCGHCRQFFCELASADSMRFVLPSQQEDNAEASKDSNEELRSHSLGELLPMRFGPEDLLDSAINPLLLQPQRYALCFAEQASQLLHSLPAYHFAQRLASTALGEAGRSYCPYTRCPCGVAIATEAGHFAGANLESAAYNPGMLPLQCALACAIAGGVEELSTIRGAVLVEKAGVPVSHESSVRSLLHSVAPHATLLILQIEDRKPDSDAMHST